MISMKRICFGLSCLVFLYSCKKNAPSSGHGPTYQPSTHYVAPQVPLDTSLFAGIMVVDRFGAGAEEEWAWFYNETHAAYIPMDHLTFNGISADAPYYRPDYVEAPTYTPHLYHTSNTTPPNWGHSTFYMDSSVFWVVYSDSSGIDFHYDFKGVYPFYLGSVPEQASTSVGLTLQLDSTTVYGADSVQITVSTDQFQGKAIRQFFSASQGAALVDLSAFAGFSSANVEVRPYKLSVQIFNGKSYAFLKEWKTFVKVKLVN